MVWAFFISPAFRSQTQLDSAAVTLTRMGSPSPPGYTHSAGKDLPLLRIGDTLPRRETKTISALKSRTDSSEMFTLLLFCFFVLFCWELKSTTVCFLHYKCKMLFCS